MTQDTYNIKYLEHYRIHLAFTVYIIWCRTAKI